MKSGAFSLTTLPLTITDWWEQEPLITEILTVQALRGISQASVYLLKDLHTKTVGKFLVLVEVTFKTRVVHVEYSTVC